MDELTISTLDAGLYPSDQTIYIHVDNGTEFLNRAEVNRLIDYLTDALGELDR